MKCEKTVTVGASGLVHNFLAVSLFLNGGQFCDVYLISLIDVVFTRLLLSH
jgi:hypothetical protein